MKTRLTERVVKPAGAGSRKYVTFDEDCADFGLCVYESGRKDFVLIYCTAARQRRFTISGAPLIETIGKLLGHTQIGTRQRYAHLIGSPLRAGVNAVGEMLRPRWKVVWNKIQSGRFRRQENGLAR